MPDDLYTVELLAGITDHKLCDSIASNPCHVLRRFYKEKDPSGHNIVLGFIILSSLIMTP